MGALSVTANAHYREPFEPLIPGVTFVAPDDIAALEAAVTEQTAAIIAEPIQGEGGVRPLSPEFAAAIDARDASDRHAADRRRDPVRPRPHRRAVPLPVARLTPDLITVGKALGSGVPIGAALVAEHVAKQIFAGDHGTTYGGNLLSTRAALYVLEQLDRRSAPHIQATIGARVRADGCDGAAAAAPGRSRAVRGAGLMRGLELTVDAQPVVEAR